MDKKLLCLLGGLCGLILLGCSAIQTSPATPSAPTPSLQPQPTWSPTPSLAPMFTPTALPVPTITPAPASAAANPFHLAPAQLAALGNATEPFVAKRQVVVQRFERGVMLIFAQTGNVFDQRGGEFIFALANDGRAWRIKDTFVETSKNPDDWYTCERKPGLRPERSGIPWRGFGKAWCHYPDVRAALGFAKIYEDSDGTAAFQSYERGRALQLADWKGYPGWKNGQVYLVFYSALTSPDFVAGKWE